MFLVFYFHSDLRLRGKDLWMSNKNLNWTLDEYLHLEVLEVVRKLSTSYTTIHVVTVGLFLCVLDIIRDFVTFFFFFYFLETVFDVCLIYVEEYFKNQTGL